LFIFSTPVLIRHPWQLKTVVFLHWGLIRAVLLLQYYANRYAESWLTKHHHHISSAGTSGHATSQTGNEKKRREKKRKSHHHSRTTGSTSNVTLNAGILSQQ